MKEYTLIMCIDPTDYSLSLSAMLLIVNIIGSV